MAKTVKAAKSAAAKKMQTPWSGTSSEHKSSPAEDAAAVKRAEEQRDRTEVDHALQPGAYDRIRGKR